MNYAERKAWKRAEDKKWRAANPERARSYNREYYLRHKEKLNKDRVDRKRKLSRAEKKAEAERQKLLREKKPWVEYFYQARVRARRSKVACWLAMPEVMSLWIEAKKKFGSSKLYFMRRDPKADFNVDNVYFSTSRAPGLQIVDAFVPQEPGAPVTLTIMDPGKKEDEFPCLP